MLCSCCEYLQPGRVSLITEGKYNSYGYRGSVSTSGTDFVTIYNHTRVYIITNAPISRLSPSGALDRLRDERIVSGVQYYQIFHTSRCIVGCSTISSAIFGETIDFHLRKGSKRAVPSQNGISDVVALGPHCDFKSPLAVDRQACFYGLVGFSPAPYTMCFALPRPLDFPDCNHVCRLSNDCDPPAPEKFQEGSRKQRTSDWGLD